MPNVQIIEAYRPQTEKERVAAYCRVSSDSTDQLHSYRAQIAHYTDYIEQNPCWELSDIYADEGVTGTGMEKRDEFNRMLSDCRTGKIDRILVKSVSRFARNTLELLETTRELTALGVIVEFEENDIDTSKALGEMQLTLHAMAAESESRSISDNIRWSYRKRMESGECLSPSAPYGYIYRDGELSIDPARAKTVREIYKMFLSGMGKQKIAHRLNVMGIPAGDNGESWRTAHVSYILSNEKYVGDTLFQKKYTTGALPFRKKRNYGELPKYLVTDTHPAIIDRDTFQKAQALIAAKTFKPGKSGHPFTGRILCPYCGCHYRRKGSGEKACWLCPQKANGFSNCPCRPISEKAIELAFLNLVAKLTAERDGIFSPVLALLREIQYEPVEENRLMELDLGIARCKDGILSLRRLHGKGYVSDEEYRVKNEKLTAERRRLERERTQKLESSESGRLISEINSLLYELDALPEAPPVFEVGLFDKLVEKMIPGEGEVTFCLRCGLTFTEVLV